MYNITAYCIFLSVLFFVTFKLGWVFYKNGVVYVRMLLPEENHLVDAINKLLLAGYYLVNLGYIVLNIAFWDRIDTLQDMCEVLFQKVGLNILLLSLLHYFNLFWLLLFSKKKKSIKHV
jgi:hypothetical protein